VTVLAGDDVVVHGNAERGAIWTISMDIGLRRRGMRRHRLQRLPDHLRMSPACDAPQAPLSRRLAAEALGTGFLLIAVVGFGILG
jgi:hypothetical protein